MLLLFYNIQLQLSANFIRIIFNYPNSTMSFFRDKMCHIMISIVSGNKMSHMRK